ncbi:D-glycero-beta-D-manno-heptose-7-phosphate kinase [Pseudorhodoplanes sinuspersici]|uniref:Bifunctional protein HldE n=1 Tax=Pseudorhodoplanes sinuspersici TaxID=1235591 RepID=A0A1W6ZTL4_9HYPH|nr:D-glycero-beta-D-manno-heptose-7-phosphate kinase [Pseudorhodoplanes sinuspersici]ARQ00692.1 bifunctional heptose 7-phosphate kinase/heptose 1-phosphate adenyltransferase [Pseudorhodoplanes sinuspersici]RKE72299.1 D-alpha,beta-D-heptose 7-phosphate 1-kinase /D-beta-D-heptose 1-phosphate adenylyltransferase [Pseudorhodoplanes sinuspersici]
MFDFDHSLSQLSGVTVLCIGDLMLDDFVYGDVARISPEAPAPVIAVKRSEMVIGGAGNVARNIASLGAQCIFIGLVGEDDAGRTLKAALAAEPRIEASLVVDGSRPTTRKVRFVSEHYATHMLRADWEEARPADAKAEKALLEHVLAALPRVDAVVLSDYAKGVLTKDLIRQVIEATSAAGKPVIVDPKGKDYSIYRGATLVTPNRKELSEAVHRDVWSDADVAAAAIDLRSSLQCEAVLVTRSDEGMTLVERDADPVHVPSYAVKISDVSGAGDTVVAVLSAMLALRADFESAMRAANAAAAVVVGKRGTATVSINELRHRILPAATLAAEEKILFDWSELDARLAAWRKQGLRIGFTNGCFDILHPGHVRMLAQARAACDRLVLGLNSDESVSRLKGPERPVQNVQSRAEVLAALEAIDLVVVFEEDTPRDLIAKIRPRVLIKGADYTREQVVGHEIVEADGGEVVLVGLVPGHSTTDIVKRSRSTAKN